MDPGDWSLDIFPPGHAGICCLITLVTRRIKVEAMKKGLDLEKDVIEAFLGANRKEEIVEVM